MLIAVEAKLYDGTREIDLKDEMDRQKSNVLDYLRDRWPNLRTIHAALLPKGMKDGFTGMLGYPVVTWEEIRDAYAGIRGASYFLEMLQIAIEEYEHLKGSVCYLGKMRTVISQGTKL